MGSSGFVPWNETPAREFPIKGWLRRRYGFAVSTSALARYAPRPVVWRQRRFPALVWVEEQQRLRASGEYTRR